MNYYNYFFHKAESIVDDYFTSQDLFISLVETIIKNDGSMDDVRDLINGFYDYQTMKG